MFWPLVPYELEVISHVLGDQQRVSSMTYTKYRNNVNNVFIGGVGFALRCVHELPADVLASRCVPRTHYVVSRFMPRVLGERQGVGGWL